MDDALIKEILTKAKTVAVVGLSSNPGRPSYKVASYLKKEGYRIIPVNPGEKEILGERCYPDLLSVPEKIDIVNIFRRPEEVMPVVKDAVKVGAGVIWMQPGVVNEEAKSYAERSGLKVVMDRCIKIERERVKRES